MVKRIDLQLALWLLGAGTLVGTRRADMAARRARCPRSNPTSATGAWRTARSKRRRRLDACPSVLDLHPSASQSFPRRLVATSGHLTAGVFELRSCPRMGARPHLEGRGPPAFSNIAP